AAALTGSVALIAGWLRGSRLTSIVGAVLLCAGILGQRSGAAPFFAIIAAGSVLLMFVPNLLRLIRNLRSLDESAPEAGSNPATVVSTIALLCTLGLGFGSAPNARAAENATLPVWTANRTETAQSIVQSW